MMALEGMRLLDISRTAPWLSMILADLGMDVIIIEEPGGGRRAQIERKTLRITPEQYERTNAFNAFRRNKKSIWHPEIVTQAPDVSDLFGASGTKWLRQAVLPGQDNQLLTSELELLEILD